MLIFHPVIPVMGENTVHLFDSWKNKQQIIRPMQLHIRRLSMCSFEQRGEIKTLARRLRIELGGHLMALLSSGKNGCAFVEPFCCLFSIALASALLFSPSISLGFILSFCLFSNFLYPAHTATPICLWRDTPRVYVLLMPSALCVFHTGQHSRVVLLQLGTQRPRPLLSHGFCSWGSKLTPAFSICLAACGTWDSETAQLTWPMNDSHGTLTEKDMGKGELVRTDGLCPVS